ncbi:putative membrane protein [Xanthomonas translucens]
MSLLVVALLIGIVAGLRAMTAPAVVSWAASLGVLPLIGTPLAFLGWRFTPWIVSLLAIGELVTDQLPGTPSRKVPLQFGTRIVMGGVCGAAVGMSGGLWVAAMVAGALGAVLGTYGGAAARAAMARRFGRDLPAALLEDAAAIGLGVLAMALLR